MIVTLFPHTREVMVYRGESMSLFLKEKRSESEDSVEGPLRFPLNRMAEDIVLLALKRERGGRYVDKIL